MKLKYTGRSRSKQMCNIPIDILRSSKTSRICVFSIYSYDRIVESVCVVVCAWACAHIPTVMMAMGLWAHYSIIYFFSLVCRYMDSAVMQPVKIFMVGQWTLDSPSCYLHKREIIIAFKFILI